MTSNKKALFESIYRQHHPMVLQMCLGFVKGDIDTAKDVTQEVFISVFKNLGTFKGNSTYKTWIYRITVNSCLQHVKKEKKKNRRPITNSMHQTADDEPETYITPNISELYKAIGQLSKIDRLIIMMVLDKEDHITISRVIGISTTNVRVKIHRIKKRLKKILNNANNE